MMALVVEGRLFHNFSPILHKGSGFFAVETTWAR